MLGMRHEAHDVPALVADAGDLVHRPVARLGVTEDDLTVRLERTDEVRRCEPSPVAVLHGDDELLPLGAPTREGKIVTLHEQRNVAADEAKRFVPEEHAWKQAGLAKNLEAVADAEHEPPRVGERANGPRGR